MGSTRASLHLVLYCTVLTTVIILIVLILSTL